MVSMNMPLLVEETRPLPVKLSEKEVATQSRRLAEILGEIAKEEESLRAIKAASKSSLEALAEELSRLRNNVLTRQETRPVTCQLRADLAAGLARVFRMDTNTEASNRPLTTEEKQMNLPGV